MSNTPIPVLITGRTQAIGRLVISYLAPEYEGGLTLSPFLQVAISSADM